MGGDSLLNCVRGTRFSFFSTGRRVCSIANRPMLQHSVSQPALHISDPNAATTVSTVVIIGTGLTGGQIGDIVLDGGALSGGRPPAHLSS